MHTVGFAETVRDLLQVSLGAGPWAQEPQVAYSFSSILYGPPLPAPLPNFGHLRPMLQSDRCGDHDDLIPRSPLQGCVLPVGQAVQQLLAGWGGPLPGNVFEFVFL